MALLGSEGPSQLHFGNADMDGQSLVLPGSEGELRGGAVFPSG